MPRPTGIDVLLHQLVANRHVLEFGLLAISLGIAGILTGIQRFRRKRLTQDLPRSKIASAAQGLVEFHGLAWPVARGAAACLSGKSAVYRRIRLQKLVRSRRNSRWITVHEDRSCLPFAVFDDTGFALVHLSTLDEEPEITSFCRHYGKLSLEQRAFLDGLTNKAVPDFPPKGLFAAKFRVEEQAILVGAPILVRGHFQAAPDLQPQALQAGLLKFRQAISIPRQSLARRFDANRDGKISAEEARNGYHSIAASVTQAINVEYEHHVPESTPTGEIYACAGVIKSSTFQRLFLADCHEQHLIQKLGRGNFLRIIAGALAISCGIYLLIGRH